MRLRYIDGDRGRQADGGKSEQIGESERGMDAVITVKVSGTGVVLSRLFGQMGVCVLIRDWVLDTVNTIKGETSFMCSASPTNRHREKKHIHTTKQPMKTVCSTPQRGRQKHTFTHKQRPARALVWKEKAQKQMNCSSEYKCWRTTKSHQTFCVISPAQPILSPCNNKHHGWWTLQCD